MNGKAFGFIQRKNRCKADFTIFLGSLSYTQAKLRIDEHK
jgi:hypothetical protein